MECDGPAEFDLDRFTTVLAGILARHVGGDGRVEVEGEVSGNINRIYRLRYGGRPLGARIALNRHRFRYEKDIIKEVFAILLLQYSSGGLNDDLARRIIDGMLSSPSGSHVGHAAVRRIVHYDWSMSEIAYPFFVFEWVEGEVLWRQPEPAQYHGAGLDLARLHRIGFEAFYQDIFGVKVAPLGWRDNFRLSYGRELDKAGAALPAGLAAGLAAVDLDLPEPRACLVHNDYAGANIIVEPAGTRRIIDWDNWVIDAPELDLVKMKYWTRLGADGVLVPDPALFAAFLAGYAEAGGHYDPRRLAAYERLWLLRTFNFESGKSPDDSAGNSWAPAYPGPPAYIRHLASL